jgi:hypothetical protein
MDMQRGRYSVKQKEKKKKYIQSIFLKKRDTIPLDRQAEIMAAKRLPRQILGRLTEAIVTARIRDEQGTKNQK